MREHLDRVHLVERHAGAGEVAESGLDAGLVVDHRCQPVHQVPVEPALIAMRLLAHG